jgi:hypothetical protein
MAAIHGRRDCCALLVDPRNNASFRAAKELNEALQAVQRSTTRWMPCWSGSAGGLAKRVWALGGQHDISPAMTKPQKAPVTGFTTGERDYIRRELDMFFSTYPSVAEGFQLKTWRGGSQAGQPKIPPTVKGLLERGLMRLDTSGRMSRLFFTDAGLAGLRAMMSDRRLADPLKFAHIRQELGIDPQVTPIDVAT